MSKKEDIVNLYNLKIKEFKKHNKLYYDKSSPNISDGEFDKLKAEILELEKKYPFLSNIKSPLNSVGFKPSKPEIADIV